MKDFLEYLLANAATIDELVSDDFEVMQGQKSDAGKAAQRLAAWCRASASGDWLLFAKRLARDGLSLDSVLPHLSTVRRKLSAQHPQWASDAIWIDIALTASEQSALIDRLHSVGRPLPFEHLIASVVAGAEERLLGDEVVRKRANNFGTSALNDLGYCLAQELSELCAPALFALFVETKERTAGQHDFSCSRYQRFVADMRDGGGFRSLFTVRPVLLRLMAMITRQWIETSKELIQRLDSDLPAISTLFGADVPRAPAVVRIQSGMSDRHNDGHSVKLLQFVGGQRVLYKPKDLRLDAAWKGVIDDLNKIAPIDLRAVRVITREGYGWAEFIEHDACASVADYAVFFKRAGALLCLFHLFVATDMHEQNMIAAGAFPVPIDLEMLFQSMPSADVEVVPETQAAMIAGKKIIESVTMVGLLPTCWRTPDNRLVGSGGLNNSKAVYTGIEWQNVNSDGMRPFRADKPNTIRNLPHVGGEPALLSDHVASLISGFREYAAFLVANKNSSVWADLVEAFHGLPTRRVQKNTRFYYLLLERLTDYRAMTDGAEWSAQLDFVSRFSDWDKQIDPFWRVARSERQSLAQLCIPHFVSSTSSTAFGDGRDYVATTVGLTGIERAKRRYASLDVDEINWQVDVITLSTRSLAQSESGGSRVKTRLEAYGPANVSADPAPFLQVATDISKHLSQLAIRDGSGASWIGLEWLGHSGLCRPATVGDDLYSGAPGISLFLAAQAKVNADDQARELSVAGLESLRHRLRGTNGARFVRSLGLGGASGVGSVIYALSTIGGLLDDETLLHDAQLAATLITSDMIAADRTLDLFDGSAGAILGLLKLYGATSDEEVLRLAVKCGEHLLQQPRIGDPGARSWLSETVADLASRGLSRPLNGMSHGACGFAYALSALGSVSNRTDFCQVAEECLAYENSSFSEHRSNWPDFRLKGSEAEPAWVSQWCHGAAGIGLSRLAMLQHDSVTRELLVNDARRAVRTVQAAWPYPGDNLCCGNLGNIECLAEAGRTLGVEEYRSEATTRLLKLLRAAAQDGQYVFDGMDRRFDLGLFRGISGVGYTCLTQVAAGIPNVLTLA